MKHLSKLPPGNYPMRLKSQELVVEEGGARWLQLVFESTYKDVYGNITISHVAVPSKQGEP